MRSLTPTSPSSLIGDLVSDLFGPARLVLSPELLKALGGDYPAAVFLSAIASETEQSSATGGWFSKTFEQWHTELYLSRAQVERAVQVLAAFGVERDVRRVNNSPVAFYRLRSDVLTQRVKQGGQA